MLPAYYYGLNKNAKKFDSDEPFDKNAGNFQKYVQTFVKNSVVLCGFEFPKTWSLKIWLPKFLEGNRIWRTSVMHHYLPKAPSEDSKMPAVPMPSIAF